MRHVADGDVLCFVVDGVEGFVGLQAEGGNGDEDEEERAKRHILQRETEWGGGGLIFYFFYSLHMKHESSPFYSSCSTGSCHICTPTFFCPA